ncbi:MAG: GIY-YIG nuclease family protein [Ignavibacteria bacterium]
MNSRTYYVYILASSKNGTLYTGFTNDLLRRVYEHKKKYNKGFSERYYVDKLVYFEQTDDVYAAISREKNIKKWYRKWKIKTIEEFNPEWKDLFYEYGGTDDMYDVYYKELKKSGFPHTRERQSNNSKAPGNTINS